MVRSVPTLSQWRSDRGGGSPRATLIKGRHIESFKNYVVHKKNKINSVLAIICFIFATNVRNVKQTSLIKCLRNV